MCCRVDKVVGVGFRLICKICDKLGLGVLLRFCEGNYLVWGVRVRCGYWVFKGV